MLARLLRRKRPHAIPEADEGKWVRAQDGDDNCEPSAKRERVVARVIIENQALTRGPKREDPEERYEQESEARHEESRKDDPIEATDRRILELLVVHRRVVVREEGARQ
jgi:hypothetical protein